MHRGLWVEPAQLLATVHTVPGNRQGTVAHRPLLVAPGSPHLLIEQAQALELCLELSLVLPASSTIIRV